MMDDTLIAALIQARVAEAHIRLEAMRTENLVRMGKGESPAYGESAMLTIIDECGISHNQVILTVRELQGR